MRELSEHGNIVVQTSALTRRFKHIVAVDHLELCVRRQNVFGFLGPNGAGKTTTIRLLLGLIQPTEGQVTIFNNQLNRNGDAILEKIGSLVETPSLYPHLTGYENLELTRRLIGGRRKQIQRALAIVDMERDARRIVRGYSTGMRQRLALARCLIGEPELLILDEPTNGLDPAGIHQIRDWIRQLPIEHGITVFLSSHLLAEVEQVATHLGIINQGKLLFQGTLQELQAQRQEQVVLEVDRPEEANRLLTHHGWRTEIAPDGKLSVALLEETDAPKINALLVESGYAVRTFSVGHPKLEDVFLELTRPPELKGDAQ
jgi:ABC-type multidrug transport system ATPase subunit